MKERGIIFDQQFIPRLLDGTKPQTRRPVKDKKLIELFDWLGGGVDDDERPGVLIQSVHDFERHEEVPLKDGAYMVKRYKYTGLLAACAEYPEDGFEEIDCPHGQVGERLKVELAEKDTCPECGYTPEDRRKKMDHSLCLVSRITLEITGIRVERIEDISEEDAIAEGLIPVTGPDGSRMWDNGFGYGQGAYPIAMFRCLWEHIYPGSWERNDWVWVIEFKILNPAENPGEKQEAEDPQ